MTLADRVLSHWRYKIQIGLFLPVFFASGYFSTQHIVIRAPVTFSLSALDRAIEFSPEWIHAYQSLYLLMPLVPLLLTRKAAISRYLQGFLWTCAGAFLIFLIFPVLSPRPEGLTGIVAFDFLTRYESRLNSFPSLHAGSLAYSLIFACWAYADELRSLIGRCLFFLALIWGLLILYATLATKQHYAVDLPAGILLAWLGHRWSGFTQRSTRSPHHAQT